MRWPGVESSMIGESTWSSLPRSTRVNVTFRCFTLEFYLGVLAGSVDLADPPRDLRSCARSPPSPKPPACRARPAVDTEPVDLNTNAVDLNSDAVSANGPAVSVNTIAVGVNSSAFEVNSFGVEVNTAAVDRDSPAVDLNPFSVSVNRDAVEVNTMVVAVNAIGIEVNTIRIELNPDVIECTFLFNDLPNTPETVTKKVRYVFRARPSCYVGGEESLPRTHSLGVERKDGRMTSGTQAPVDLSSLTSQIAAHLDQIQALIPDYTPPEPARRKHVAANARFANEAIQPAITATENYSPLGQTNVFDVEAGRRALALRDALRPLMVRMQALVDGGNFTIDVGLATAGVQVLQVYDWSKRHLRLPEAAALRPYVDDIARMIEKTLNHRPKKTAKDEPPAQSFMAPRRVAIPDDVDEIAELIAESGDDEA